MTTRTIASLVLFLVFSAQLTARSDSLDTVFNAFIATFAKERVDWRKDIALTTDPHEIPAGRQLGFSKAVGYFTFQPKDWSDFTPSERFQISQHPKFQAFIISLRNANTYPSVGVAEDLTGADRQDINLNPNSPSYPVDGVATGTGPKKRVSATIAGASPAGPLTDLMRRSAVVTDTTLKKDVIQIDVSPEQLIQREDLRIELY